ncbi:MAG: T9SS type A sorting domain-containing protein, partial [Bacteroidota bacterium]
SASPIPFQDQLSLALPTGMKSTVQITDVTGRVILDGISLIGGAPTVINTSPWESGVYFVRSIDGKVFLRLLKS